MLWIAALWGGAEATLWFLVADIPISVIAVRFGWRSAALAALFAALGAAVGGAWTYVWASFDPMGATRAMLALPAIDAPLVILTAVDFATHGYRGMLHGALTGTPYKLYVLAAAAQHEPILRLVAMTPLVRLPRFLAVCLLSAGIGHLLSGWLSMRARLIILGIVWVIFYAIYFMIMSG